MRKSLNDPPNELRIEMQMWEEGHRPTFSQSQVDALCDLMAEMVKAYKARITHTTHIPFKHLVTIVEHGDDDAQTKRTD